jgi:hypothetical protein
VRGKECGYAHVKDASAPRENGGGKGATSNTQCKFFLQGNCRYGKECKDLHGNPGKGKRAIKERGEGKGQKGSKDSSAPAVEPAAAAISMREGVGIGVK